MADSPQESRAPCRKLAVVVGAGVAGVQSARALLRAGFDVLILEQGRGIGGVWRRNYHSFGLQVPWLCYTFPEFPYDLAPTELAERAKAEVFPSGTTVQEYVSAYCAHFQLERHILLGAKVVHLGALPGGRWSLRFRQALSPAQAAEQGALKTMEADLVVMATGMYYSPYVPAVPGLPSFRGKVLHARDFTCADILRGKRVLVLGAGKSAHDCSVVAASPAASAASVTTVFRQAHWPLPRMLFGIPFHKLVYTRFTAAMLPGYYTGQGRAAKRVKNALLSPLKRLFWGTLEAHVASKMRLRGHLRPEAGFVEDLFYGGQIQDGAWNEAVNAGAIKAVQGSLAEVLPGGVRLSDGTHIECDVIIFATGYAKDYSLFDAATATRLQSTCPGTDGLHLYRSILSPWVPNLYFIGCEASTFNNVLTSGLQSLWMLHHLLGKIRLPTNTEVMKDIQDQRSWRQGVMPPQCYSSSGFMLYQQRYHDQLVADMGHRTRRKRARRRGGSECFGVYTSEDYTDLFHDEAVPKPAVRASPPPPLRSAAEVMAAAVTLMPAAAAIGARLDLAVLPGAAGGGGGGAQRRGVLLPVCNANSGGAAIAVAPGIMASGADLGPDAVAAAQNALGMQSCLIGSFDSPKLTVEVDRAAAATAAAIAAAKSRNAVHNGNGVGLGAAHRPLAQPPAAAAAPSESGPDGSAAADAATKGPPPQLVAVEAVVAEEEGAAAAPRAAAAATDDFLILGANAHTIPTAAGLDTTTSERPSLSPSPSGIVSNSHIMATGATVGTAAGAGAGIAGAGAGGPASWGASVVTGTGAVAAGSSNAGSNGGAATTPPRPPIPLVQRVKLSVLHLLDRSPGGSLVPVSGARGEEVLELHMQSHTGLSSRQRESSMLMATSVAATGGGATVSGNLCIDPVRHAAPNVYSELVGTLEVH